MMDTESLWQAIAAYGNARWRGVKFEQDAADHLSEIKAILNRSEAETRELLATNERLVDEVAELKQRVAGLEANEKVLLAQVQGHTQWREKIINASVSAYGESAIRYKFSLTKSGKCMNTFPREIDGRWFALTPAEDDGHIGHIARIQGLTDENAELKAKLTEKASLLRGCYAADHKQKQRIEELTAELERIKANPIIQFRKPYCADWFDGYPDPTDGGGPYETRTLYALGSKTA